MAKEIVNLFGFSIKENSLYEIKEKLDPDAPDGFRENETTKILTNDVSNEEPGAVWNASIGAWDTGLFMGSPFLRSAFPNETARESVVNTLNKYIVEPIEGIKGAGALNNTVENDSFWNNYRVSVKRGAGFNTGNPEQLFQLFILVLTKRLTPKGMTSHPEFKQSQYEIVDKEASNRSESDKVLRTVKAYSLFGAFNSSDKAHLINVLDYVGLRGVNEKTEEDTLTLAFKHFIEDPLKGIQNAKDFIDLLESKDKNMKTKIYTYGKVKEYLLEGRLTKKQNDIYLDDTFLGSSIKNAAEAIVSDKALMKLFNAIGIE